MKKIVKTILLLAILAGVMFFTCPEEEKHVDKLTQEIVASVNDSQKDDTESNIIEDIGNAIAGTLSEKVVHLYVKSQLKVENYTLLNVGKMNYDGEKRVVTIGAFNHVFCLVKAYDLLDDIKAQ
jgi:hypothetical protein